MIKAICAKFLTLFLTLTVALVAVSAHAGIDPGALCKDKKGKAVGKYTSDLLKAFGANRKTTNLGKLGTDISKAQSKLTKGFTRAEFSASGVDKGCQTLGDAGSFDADVDAFVVGALADLCPPTTISTTTSTSTTTTTASPTTTTTCPQFPAQFPATGQTTCWNSAGAVIACAGTGHDGDIQAGATLSYTDNGDGTITDDNTGLMWEKKSDDGSIHDKDTTYTWANAFAVHVAGLNGGGGFAGYTDWRLPNVKELQSIVDYELVNPTIHPAFNFGCLAACTVTTCSCTRSSGLSSYYWSSTSYAANPTFAWHVLFSLGDTNANDFKTSGNFVRAVRGGS